MLLTILELSDTKQSMINHKLTSAKMHLKIDFKQNNNKKYIINKKYYDLLINLRCK